jgi:hypothetical protein
MNRKTIITVCKLADDDYTVRVHGGFKWTFDGVIDKLKNGIPSFARRWEPHNKAWRIRSDQFLHRWLDICLWDDEVEAAWEKERQHQPPPRQPKATARAAAFVTLHLLPTAPPELVKAAHKTLALLHHPDKGGDLRTMQAINAAYDVLNVN